MEQRVPINSEQKAVLLQFMKDHYQLQTGKFSASFTCKVAEKLWREAADILNSIPGAKKDWKAWRKVRLYGQCMSCFLLRNLF